ncbi:MAG TPA: hypothetical protein PKJ99_16670 [Thermoanaerobaculales bacterium]|nr:hypothetical protein [Thermoanaerobaculales bacterium]HPA80099.1 hypothetical protein [Thermoanaerobaculales bacterium]HQL29171.1 hypothetical protein [Thermoanaerobaculales bacterium]HQN95587.1 hypothetical protein [Thermoanaerobaculales bacterium]HQP44034.1 hypothetical protein [Thermoanaerobaculales bacterium]
MKLRRDELPLHFEGLRLRRWIVLSGWPLALVAAATGVAVAGLTRDPLGDAVGLVLAVVGGTLIAALVRCRRCEIVVGPSLLTLGAGPFRRRMPVGVLEHPELRAACSWRRLYADLELAFDLPAHGDTVALPTADPEALQGALLEARTTRRSSASG